LEPRNPGVKRNQFTTVEVSYQAGYIFIRMA
jgi:hypothetical protein